MLSYTVDGLRQKGLTEKIEAEQFENINELLAEILIDLVSRQLKRGLIRKYNSLTEDLLTVRGKIIIGGTIKNRVALRRNITVESDNLSDNIFENQIIKSSIRLLLRSEISDFRKKKLAQLLKFFDEIGDLKLQSVNFSKIKNCRDKNYAAILVICQFLAESLILSEETGERSVRSFLTESALSRIFESFIREFYRRHFSCEFDEISKKQIKWDLTDGGSYFLPVMETDIFLRKGEKVAILDAKFYKNIFSKSQFGGVGKLSSANLYQIYSYVKNFQANSPHFQISGGLIYTKTSEKFVPDEFFSIGGNNFIVRAIDLDCDFSEIKVQLEGIVSDIFGIRVS